MPGVVKFENLENKLIEMNGELVLLDKNVADLYEIEPKKLRQQLKRNMEKFPKDYAYQLTEDDINMMVSQNVTPSKQVFGGSLPYVFTEKGLYMVATILKSNQATKATFTNIETFAKIKKLSRNLNTISTCRFHLIYPTIKNNSQNSSNSMIRTNSSMQGVTK